MITMADDTSDGPLPVDRRTLLKAAAGATVVGGIGAAVSTQLGGSNGGDYDVSKRLVVRDSEETDTGYSIPYPAGKKYLVDPERWGQYDGLVRGAAYTENDKLENVTVVPERDTGTAKIGMEDNAPEEQGWTPGFHPGTQHLPFAAEQGYFDGSEPDVVLTGYWIEDAEFEQETRLHEGTTGLEEYAEDERLQFGAVDYGTLLEDQQPDVIQLSVGDLRVFGPTMAEAELFGEAAENAR